MSKLVNTSNELKSFMKIRDVSLEELSKESKICKTMLQDIIDGKRIMPDYLMKVLGKISSKNFKTWKNMQDLEIKKNNIQIGERGLVL